MLLRENIHIAAVRSNDLAKCKEERVDGPVTNLVHHEAADTSRSLVVLGQQELIGGLLLRVEVGAVELSSR